MSKKLEKAVSTGSVRVKSRIASQLSIWYIDREGKRQYVVLDPFGETDLAPSRTDAQQLIRSSNIKDLVKRGKLQIV